mgnify:FL=1
MKKRVVITGLGAITPIGKNVLESWNSIKQKKCGIDEITLFDASNFKTKLDAEVKEYDQLEYFDLKQAKRLDRSSQFAIIAAREAIADSKIERENTDFDRVGTFVSSGIAGLTTIQNQCEAYFEKGNKRVSPMFIPMSIANMPSGNIAIEFGFKGESMGIVTACASSTHSIGEAYKTIIMGQEDIVVAGGTESSICEVGVAGFENMKALSSSTDKNRASIPFDKERNGFVMGEGAGVVVLEELEHALKRNANIYAEIIGYGATTDAYHITSPCPDGDGAKKAMIRAIENANINSNDIDYINAHGTSTHLNDSTETMAIKNVFKEKAYNLPVSSTKGNTGHLLGAAGGVEAIFCIKALQDQIIPPTINYKEKDEECDLDIVANEVRNAKLNVVMSNSLGFGGHNSSIILKRWEGR